ncbi:hypothetical protein J132_07366 [Termitomyces sp. J132]|nr:hypothetical protein H2248_010261 [Termitomyces sp. 'cryptogamus']KNZ74314.1 hypothetical protein J132_07366 [Termitomyces sp. J132]
MEKKAEDEVGEAEYKVEEAEDEAEAEDEVEEAENKAMLLLKPNWLFSHFSMPVLFFNSHEHLHNNREMVVVAERMLDKKVLEEEQDVIPAHTHDRVLKCMVEVLWHVQDSCNAAIAWQVEQVPQPCKWMCTDMPTFLEMQDDLDWLNDLMVPVLLLDSCTSLEQNRERAAVVE